jgi:nitrate reductase alpha subunit
VLTPQRAGEALKLADGEALVATVFDLLLRQLRRRPRAWRRACRASYDDDVPYTPAWAEKITGVRATRSSPGGARIRHQCRKDQWQVDGHHRRRR